LRPGATVAPPRYRAGSARERPRPGGSPAPANDVARAGDHLAVVEHENRHCVLAVSRLISARSRARRARSQQQRAAFDLLSVVGVPASSSAFAARAQVGGAPALPRHV